MPALINPTVDFLDAPCSVDRYNKRWTIIRVLNFGTFAFQETDKGEANILQEVGDVVVFEINNRLELVTHSEGVYNVRNICGAKCKVRSDVRSRIDYWINVITPREDMINTSKVRLEVYTNEADARRDAKDETALGYDVYTRKRVVFVENVNPRNFTIGNMPEDVENAILEAKVRDDL